MDFAEPEKASEDLSFPRASTFRRVTAWIIDSACLGVFAVLLFKAGLALAGLSAGESSPESGLDWIVDTVTRYWSVVKPLLAFVAIAGFVYATLTHALMGATVGKRLAGLRVVTTRGQIMTIPRSAVRAALALISLAALGLGFIAALFTRTHRSFHDLVARTYVVQAR